MKATFKAGFIIALGFTGKNQALYNLIEEVKEDHLAFSVPDLDAACNELESTGLLIQIPLADY